LGYGILKGAKGTGRRGDRNQAPSYIKVFHSFAVGSACVNGDASKATPTIVSVPIHLGLSATQSHPEVIVFNNAGEFVLK